MAAWLERVARRGEPALWLDDTAYAGRLLAGGAVPWLETTALIAWRLRAQALLQPSLVALDVGAVAAAHAAGPARAALAAAGPRPLAPLTALLAEEALRRHLLATLAGLRASSPRPLALVVPSPAAWPAQVAALVHGTRPAIDRDAADDAAVAIAGFLRAFGACGVDALLLTEDAASAPATAAALEDYAAVGNVARHYRWDLGLRLPAVPPGSRGVDFMVAPVDAAGIEVEAAFWDDTAAALPLPPGGFRYAVIPERCAPERVLARLAALRAP